MACSIIITPMVVTPTIIEQILNIKNSEMKKIQKNFFKCLKIIKIPPFR